MSGMQAQVKDMYLRVIDQTIDTSRTELAENGAEEAMLANLETLKTRWVQRLIATQDFTEDPALVRASSGAGGANRRSSAAGGAGQVGSVGPSSKKRSAKGGAGEPAKKRPRHEEEDDGEPTKANSDLGSSSDDSDIGSAGSDPEVDNYILAQHDRVRKGTGKWKVHLKEGVAHINGRDYLFNKAICDLDW